MNKNVSPMNEIDIPLATMFERNWAANLLRGIVAILVGALAWQVPQSSLTSLVLLFAVFAFLDGIIHIWVSLAGRKKFRSWWALLLGRVLGVGVGVTALFAPALAWIAVIYVMAFWAISSGVLQIIAYG